MLGRTKSTKVKSFITFFKPSITGPDGNASSKKLTMFAFMLCYVFMVVSCRVWECNFPDIAWITAAAGAGVSAAINAYQNVGIANRKPRIEGSREIILPEES